MTGIELFNKLLEGVANGLIIGTWLGWAGFKLHGLVTARRNRKANEAFGRKAREAADAGGYMGQRAPGLGPPPL